MSSAHRSRLEWHCRRGMRELDVILMRYMNRDYDGAGQTEKASFEALLSLQDPEILDLLTGRLVAEDEDIRHVIERILANSRPENH
ncbi:MAG: succinate dehydrogenase assembly factor 2 [Gammaproteobacteria bacterium]|jgi:antitoxin CptB|nr:succinate dehydrogenase assembly factor 2 [Chromatiales bacterium]MDP6675344.1 succinate dehydrogenase assembly factor 2 [Gammaproteobacteria bacterium]